MMINIKIVNKYGGEDCYLSIYESHIFHICDKDGHHIEDHNLFSIDYNGLLKFDYIGEDTCLSPCIEVDSNDGRSLIISGVDEL